jgi:hypothetical protein
MWVPLGRFLPFRQYREPTPCYLHLRQFYRPAPNFLGQLSTGAEHTSLISYLSFKLSYLELPVVTWTKNLCFMVLLNFDNFVKIRAFSFPYSWKTIFLTELVHFTIMGNKLRKFSYVKITIVAQSRLQSYITVLISNYISGHNFDPCILVIRSARNIIFYLNWKSFNFEIRPCLLYDNQIQLN